MLALTPPDVLELLVSLAPDRSAFVWGPPGVGKSALVREAAERLGMPCVTLLGTQIAPEDLIGVPRIRRLPSGRDATEFCPPAAVLRDSAFVLFVDELNSAVPDVQKTFYSLILDRRLGEYRLPEGSRVVGAGNRAEDRALVRPMPTALANRMIHVALQPSAEAWLDWAATAGVHPLVLAFVRTRPQRLVESPPADATPAYPTPRAWHMLSDALATVPDRLWHAVAVGSVGERAGTEFHAFARRAREVPSVEELASGARPVPDEPDLQYFAATAVLAHLARPEGDAGRAAGEALRRIGLKSQEIAAWALDAAFARPLPTEAFRAFDVAIRTTAGSLLVEVLRLQRFRKEIIRQ